MGKLGWVVFFCEEMTLDGFIFWWLLGFFPCGDKVKLQVEHLQKLCSPVSGKKPNLNSFLNYKKKIGLF